MSKSSSSVDEMEQITDHHHARTYPCRLCPKTFSTPMARGGHQNAHKVRDATHHTYHPYLTSSRLSSVNPFSSTEMRMNSMVHQPSIPIVDSSSSLSRKNSWCVEEVNANIGMERFYGSMITTRPSAPLAPPPPVKSTMFFGVLDFFKPSAPSAPSPPSKSTMFFGVPDFFKPAAPKNPPSAGASTSTAVVIVNEEEDEEKVLDLDLKL